MMERLRDESGTQDPVAAEVARLVRLASDVDLTHGMERRIRARLHEQPQRHRGPIFVRYAIVALVLATSTAAGAWIVRAAKRHFAASPIVTPDEPSLPSGVPATVSRTSPNGSHGAVAVAVTPPAEPAENPTEEPTIRSDTSSSTAPPAPVASKPRAAAPIVDIDRPSPAQATLEPTSPAPSVVAPEPPPPSQDGINKSGERPTRSSAGGDAEMINKSGERPTRSSAGGDAEMIDGVGSRAVLVLRARVALRRDRDARGALALVEQYVRENPDGALVEEALALEIEASYTLGDHRATRAAAAAYLRRFPAGRFADLANRAAAISP